MALESGLELAPTIQNGAPNPLISGPHITTLLFDLSHWSCRDFYAGPSTLQSLNRSSSICVLAKGSVSHLDSGDMAKDTIRGDHLRHAH